MSTSLEHLLPDVDDTVRCAEHARSIDVDPGGTAIRADRVVVVATPGRWPKPAVDHPLLVGAVAAFSASPTPTRVLAAHPDTDGEGSVVVFDRIGATAVERVYAFSPDRPDELSRLADLLASEVPGSDRDPGAEFLVATYEPARPTALICAQGTHDVCCGAQGTRLALAIEADTDRLPEVRVLRVSHTGGHRFAPTGMTLPDGRMWAALDLDDVAAWFTPDASLGTLVDRCRGWWGADTGHAQVAERAVLALVGRDLDAVDRTVTVADADTDTDAGHGEANGAASARRCTVTAGARSWIVDVAIGRDVPTIACRQPGGLPTKPGREYRVLSIAER